MSLFDDPPLRDFPDRAFRRLLEDPANLRDLLAAAHPGLSPHLDFSRVERVQRDFLMEDWRERECDLFFRIPYKTPDMEQWVVVCVLVEHQSAPDPRMPLRMLLYAVLYWEREWKKWEDHHEAYEPLRLTPIVPVVFYTGHVPWNASRELADLIGGPEEFRPFAPRWDTLFWNLSEQSPDALLSSAAAWLQALAVVRAEEEDPTGFRAVFGRVLQRLAERRETERMRALDLLWFVLSWAAHRRPRREKEDLLVTLEANVPDPETQKEIVAMSDTLDQTWAEWAEAQAQEREQRSERLGQLSNARHVLRALLEEKFGTVPEALAERIEACQDLDRLNSCARQVLRINSPEELTL
jgi:hypothetical protein